MSSNRFGQLITSNLLAMGFGDRSKELVKSGGGLRAGLRAGAVIGSFLFVALIGSAVPAVADPEGQEVGARVFKGFNCNVPTAVDPVSHTVLSRVVTDDMHAVITPSGNATLTCKVTGSIEPFTATGFPCAVGPAGVTTDSSVKWTKGGQGILTCHLHA